MANRRYTSQFMYSFERQPVALLSAISQSGSVGAKATLVNNGITWTAVKMGAAGNSITIALVAGGTAGAEVVSVIGNAISVSIQSGVSTRTQVLTAVQASAPASALVTISVASGGTAATPVAATALASGVSTVFTQSGSRSGMSLEQIDTGIYQIDLADPYAALLSASIMLQRSSGAVDLIAQISSVNVAVGSQTIQFRMLTGATPTNMASGDVLLMNIILRNSGASGNSSI